MAVVCAWSLDVRCRSVTLRVVRLESLSYFEARSGVCLFEVVMRRYKTRSTMMTSNRPLEDWGKLSGDARCAAAILDGFLHDAELVQMTGRSYRLRHQATPGRDGVEDSKPAIAPSGSAGEQPRSKPATAPFGSGKA
jgi:hypothetical protein